MIRLSPSLVLIISSIMGIAVSFALMMVGALWARMRSLPLDKTSRLVDDLARRQESIAALLARLDAQRDAESAAESAPVSPGNGGLAQERRPNQPQPQPQRADRAKPSAVGGPTLIVVPSLVAGVPNASSAAAAELGERFGAIWALADSGQSPEAIARTTGQPVGQVELILGLRRQLTNQPAEQP
jgi:hypothetical protein